MPTGTSNIFKSYSGFGKRVQVDGKSPVNLTGGLSGKTTDEKDKVAIIREMRALLPGLQKALTETGFPSGNRNVTSALQRLLGLNYHQDPEIRWEAGNLARKLVRGTKDNSAKKLIASAVLRTMLVSDPFLQCSTDRSSGTRHSMHLRPSAAYCHLLHHILRQIPVHNVQRDLAERIEEASELARAYLDDCKTTMRSQDVYKISRQEVDYKNGKNSLNKTVGNEVKSNHNSKINSKKEPDMEFIKGKPERQLLDNRQRKTIKYDVFAKESFCYNLNSKIILEEKEQTNTKYLLSLTQKDVVEVSKNLTSNEIKGLVLTGLIPEQPEKEHKVYQLNRLRGSDVLTNEKNEVAIIEEESMKVFLIHVEIERCSTEERESNCVIM